MDGVSGNYNDHNDMHRDVHTMLKKAEVKKCCMPNMIGALQYSTM